MNDALGLPGRSRRVENEERLFGVHDLGLAVRLEAVADIGICDVAALLHRDVCAGTGDDDHGRDGGPLQRRIDVALQWDFLAAAHALVCSDDC